MARKSAVTVVGAGPVAFSVVEGLQRVGITVKIVAERLPGEGITGDLAAGAGLFYRPSSPVLGRMTLESYPTWMWRANRWPAVRPTTIVATTDGAPVTWGHQVRNFCRRDSRTIYYRSYTFDPQALGEYRMDLALLRGAQIEHRPLSAPEVERLRRGRALEGSDYTVVCIGLNTRAIQPDLGLYGIRGVLVHFGESAAAEDVTYIDEETSTYLVPRPNGVVAGGTFDAHVETCSLDEELALGSDIVNRVNQRWNLDLDFDNRTRITVGYRPAVPGDPILRFGNSVGYVTGFGGHGWVVDPALARYSTRRILARLRARR